MKTLTRVAVCALFCASIALPAIAAPCPIPQDEAPVASPTAPALPKIQEKACPFECCEFGRWKAEKAMPIYDSWKADRKQVGTLRAGETVTSVDGIFVTYSPDVIRIKQDMPKLGLKGGDRVLRYMYAGEGVAQFWFKGKFYPSLELTAEGKGDQPGDCSGQCDGVIVERGKQEWWVKVRRKDGSVGWALGDGGFSGMGECAG